MTTVMVGILVHGDNHFIVRGPSPNRDVALALVRHWSLIQIGATMPPAVRPVAHRHPRVQREPGMGGGRTGRG
jgi:hypothetical protein